MGIMNRLLETQESRSLIQQLEIELKDVRVLASTKLVGLTTKKDGMIGI
jgi:hypothetical protein